MKFYIKNMVCKRCILAVKAEFTKVGLDALTVSLGEVEVDKTPDAYQLKSITAGLRLLGFEIIDDKRAQSIERIKTSIIELVQDHNNLLKMNLSDFLEQKTHHDYHYLSNLFSQVEGTTIEKYYIAQKIEKVKELLIYDELSLSEIAFELNYSSVAYLSNQFYKITGLRPSYFKQLRNDLRKPLDEV